MKIDYIGWAGHRNLGDDACLRSVRRLLAPHEVVQTKHPRSGACLVGGGTLVYGEAFLRPAEEAVVRKARIGVFGAGVDLAVPVDGWEPARREAWRGVLSAATVVGVRGPESLAAVNRLAGSATPGAELIGDPALTLGRSRPPQSGNHDRRLVLVNAGSDFVPGCGRLRLQAELMRGVEWLKKLGLECRFLALRPNDLEHARPLVEQCRLPVIAPHLDRCLDAVRRAHLVISLRLHGAVFAAAFGVPFVSLSYRPKCRDFAASMEVPWAAVEVEDISWEMIRAAVERIDADYDQVAIGLCVAADEFRRRQRDLARRFMTG